jgi:DNA-binding transcriptional LysR family regulator
MDLSTRALECFVCVAEERSFTRAAAALYTTQPALSRQIRQLEQRLGFNLFNRTSRHVELSDAGAVFLVEVRTALETLERGVQRGRQAQRQRSQRLRIGFLLAAALELTPLILSEFRLRCPEVSLEMHEDIDDPSAGLANGTTDVALLRLPISAKGVLTETLYVEQRSIAVPPDHPLGQRSSVRLRDVVDLPLIGTTIPDPAFADFWSLNDCRDGSCPPATIVFEMEENPLAMLERVAAGAACMVSDATESRLLGRPSVCHVPIVDIPGSAVAVAWRADHETDLVRTFVQTALAVRDRESGLIESVTKVATGP